MKYLKLSQLRDQTSEKEHNNADFCLVSYLCNELVCSLVEESMYAHFSMYIGSFGKIYL